MTHALTLASSLRRQDHVPATNFSAHGERGGRRTARSSSSVNSNTQQQQLDDWSFFNLLAPFFADCLSNFSHHCTFQQRWRTIVVACAIVGGGDFTFEFQLMFRSISRSNLIDWFLASCGCSDERSWWIRGSLHYSSRSGNRNEFYTSGERHVKNCEPTYLMCIRC
jgi:hypothetical protein